MRKNPRNNRLAQLAAGGSLLALAAFSLPALAEPTMLLGAPAGDDPAVQADDGADAAFHAPKQKFFSRSSLRELVVREALLSDVPPELALAVAKVESNFNADALSSKGARGVMQIMPATAAGEFGVQKDELWDPELNVRLGVEYLARLYEHYGQRWDAALSHYNGGTLDGDSPHTAEPSARTEAYVASVLDWRDRYATDRKTVLMVADARSALGIGDQFAGGPFSAEASQAASRIPAARASRYAYNDEPVFYDYPVTGETPSAALYRDIDDLRQRFRTSLRVANRRYEYRRAGDWRTP